MSKPIKRDFGDRTIPAWVTGRGGESFTDITYEVADGIAKITINRPEVRNAFRPQTIIELKSAFDLARDNSEVGVIILTGKGDEAFCSGGDINVRGDDGYLGDDSLAQQGVGRLNVLDLQVQIRRTPKPVVAMIGTVKPASRSCRQSTSPFMRRIWMSRNIASNRRPAAARPVPLSLDTRACVWSPTTAAASS